MSKESLMYVHKANALTTVAAISVGNASATQHPLSAGKGYIAFMNTGSKAVWMGDTNVDPGEQPRV